MVVRHETQSQRHSVTSQKTSILETVRKPYQVVQELSVICSKVSVTCVDIKTNKIHEIYHISGEVKARYLYSVVIDAYRLKYTNHIFQSTRLT